MIYTSFSFEEMFPPMGFGWFMITFVMLFEVNDISMIVEAFFVALAPDVVELLILLLW